MSGELPSIFYQRTERNERMASLLSSVYYRSIRPSFAPAIRRHPLSLWSTSEEDALATATGGEKRIPIILFLEEPSCSERSTTISRVLKEAVADSGFLIVELRQQGRAERESILSSLNPVSGVFVIEIKEDVLLVDELNLEGSNSSSPSLVLVSEGDQPNVFSPEIHRHQEDPNTTVVSLPEALESYGDDGPKSLWVARTVLKFLKAAQTTRISSSPIRSRL